MAEYDSERKCPKCGYRMRVHNGGCFATYEYCPRCFKNEVKLLNDEVKKLLSNRKKERAAP